MKPATFILFIVLYMGTCAGIVAQEQHHIASTVPDHLKLNADAVVRLDQTLVTVESRRDMTIYTKRIVTVLNEKGDRYVYPVAYYSDSRKITKLYARIYDASGKEIEKIKEKDFADRPRLNGALYTDSRYKVMNYVPVTYPYTVEFVSETKTRNTASLPDWHPVTDYYVSTEKSEYKVTCPPETGLRYKEVNMAGYPVKGVSENALLHYEATALPAVLPEEYSPSFGAMFPKLLVTLDKFHVNGVDGDISDWNDMGIWMSNSILAGRDQLPEATKQQVKRLVENIDDPMEKARKVVEYVQENTRYISVQVGIGGIQPIPASEVDEVKYGDCKGLTNYTKALLEVAGVPSYYTVVEAGSEKEGLEEDFASLGQGNHAILCIPDGEKNVFMDCTSQVHPFGFIGDFTDDRRVLIVKPEGGEIVTTTSYVNDENYQKTTAKVTIAENGTVTANVDILTKGIQYDSRFPLDRASEEDRKKYYKKYWGNINNLQLKEIHHHNDKAKVQFTQHVAMSFDNYVTPASGGMLVTVNMFNNTIPVPTRYRNRKFPVEISRGFLDEDEYTIEIPDNHTVASLPDPVKIENEFGSYEMHCEASGEKQIVFRRKFALKKGLHGKEDYNDFRDFIKKVSRSDQSKLIINKKT